MDENFCAPGSDSKTARGSETTSGRAEATKGEWGKRPDNFQRQNCSEKKTTVFQHELKCFYINARSLVSKFDQLEAWVHDLKPDIIGITESWTTSQVLDSELALPGYDLFRQDRPVSREGGGVLLYVKSSLHAVQFSLCAKFPEHVWCYFLDSAGCKF